MSGLSAAKKKQWAHLPAQTGESRAHWPYGKAFRPLPHGGELARLAQELGRNRLLQLPDDAHRTAALMLHVIHLAQESVGFRETKGVLLVLTTKEH